MSNQDVNVNTGNALGAIFQRRPISLPVQFLSPGAGAPRVQRFAQGYTGGIPNALAHGRVEESGLPTYQALRPQLGRGPIAVRPTNNRPPRVGSHQARTL